MDRYIWRCDLSRHYENNEKEINEAVAGVLKSGVYTLGKEVRQFEEEFAAYVGCAYGIGVASGTDALVLALVAAGIGRGDRVITTVFAPVPVPTAIVLAGGIPVFADIEESTCLVDPAEVAKKASSKARFIVPVHIFGSVCDMDAIGKIAKKKGMTVVEDCAQAHGSTYKGRRAGTFGNLSCFSFYPTKNLGCYGDGGMILTDSKKMAGELRLLRNYGKKNNPFDSEVLGFNSRLDEVQASVLRIKLRQLDGLNEKRAALVRIYKEGLRGLPIDFLSAGAGSLSNHHILTVLCRTRRDALIKFLEGRGIQTNVYYPRPLCRMNAFKRYAGKNERFPVSEKVCGEAIALPLYPELEEGKVVIVTDAIRDFYKGKKG